LECGYVGFCGGRKTGEPGGKPSEHGENQQQTKPAYATGLELNSGLIEERLVLSPLHHPCSPEERERGDNLICVLWVTILCPLSRQMKRVSSHLLMQKIVMLLDWSALYEPCWLLTPLHVFLTLCLTFCVKVHVWWELVRRLCLLDSICWWWHIGLVVCLYNWIWVLHYLLHCLLGQVLLWKCTSRHHGVHVYKILCRYHCSLYFALKSLIVKVSGNHLVIHFTLFGFSGYRNTGFKTAFTVIIWTSDQFY